MQWLNFLFYYQDSADAYPTSIARPLTSPALVICFSSQASITSLKLDFRQSGNTERLVMRVR